MTSMQVAALGLGLAFLAHFAGVVWLIGSIRSGLTQLTATTKDLNTAVTAITKFTANLNTRLAVVEDRQTRPGYTTPHHLGSTE